MPYLRITCPEVDPVHATVIATRLTEVVNDLFYDARAPVSREELRQHTTIHFTPYSAYQLFIGAQTPAERGTTDITVELSDWSMSVRQQRKIALVLTSMLAELFHVPPQGIDGINLRFHSYSPNDFAVGGKLLSELVPKIGQVMKRLFG